jgi:hypothetical protein
MPVPNDEGQNHTAKTNASTGSAVAGEKRRGVWLSTSSSSTAAVRNQIANWKYAVKRSDQHRPKSKNPSNRTPRMITLELKGAGIC